MKKKKSKKTPTKSKYIIKTTKNIRAENRALKHENESLKAAASTLISAVLEIEQNASIITQTPDEQARRSARKALDIYKEIMQYD